MAKSRMTINKTIKYKRQVIIANTPFEVDADDVQSLREEGAHVIESVGSDEDDSDEEIIPSLEVLVARAEELGIEVGNKQEKTLLKLVKKAEAGLE